MRIAEELIALGFTNFTYDNCNRQELYERKTRTEVHNNRVITFQLVCIGGEWSVEKILFDINNNDDYLKEFFGNPFEISKVIDFVRQAQA